jgi:CheY-like chemotaxis protein
MLVAEDSEGLAEMIASSFCQSFTVAVARTGREAVAIIDGRPGFDICLVDVVMPPESPGMSLADAMTTGIRIVRRMIDTGKCRRFLVVTVRHDVEATLKATIGDSAHWKVLLKQTSGPEDLRAAVEELMAIKV